jgi:hypothetical protein
MPAAPSDLSRQLVLGAWARCSGPRTPSRPKVSWRDLYALADREEIPELSRCGACTSSLKLAGLANVDFVAACAGRRTG